MNTPMPYPRPDDASYHPAEYADQQQTHGHGGHGLMMLVCCIPMLAVVVLLVVFSPASAGALVWGLGCLIMMAAMMRFMPGEHDHR